MAIPPLNTRSYKSFLLSIILTEEDLLVIQKKFKPTKIPKIPKIMANFLPTQNHFLRSDVFFLF
jgi:hypothetical protein